MANDSAKKNTVEGIAKCYALTHRRDTPCDSTEHPCPLVIVKQTGEQAERAKLDGFLVKPVSQSLLYNTILEIFGQEVSRRASSAEERPEGFEQVRGARILVVEDNEINQQVAAETLEAEGFVVEIATDGQDALEKITQEPRRYDMVFMDLQMPRLNGYEATRQIRSRDELKELPVVAMTADAMSGVREQVLDSGMNDYLTKPIEPAQLWEALGKWIRPAERQLPSGFKGPHAADSRETESVNLEIRDLDTDEGLRRVGGNRRLYEELLAKFNRDFRGATEEIRRRIADDDIAPA